MKLVCLSDTHMKHGDVDVPEGDIFIFAGDMCREGSLDQVKTFRDDFLDPLPHEHKIVIAGNHDYPFEDHDGSDLLPEDCTYLEDEAVTIDGVTLYGAPWQPEFCNWAFNLPRGESLAEKWSMIPEETDVLITHGPPDGIMDGVYRGRSISGMRTGRDFIEHAGCNELLKRVYEVEPDLHVFGHIHEHTGLEEHDGMTFANVSYLGQRGDDEPPYVIDM